MRPRTACTACRRRQRRCVIKKSDVACVYCMQHHLECSLTAEKSSQVTEQSSSSRADSQTPSHRSQLPHLNVLLAITAAYFNHIHNPTHQLFHESSFMTDLTRSRVSRSTLLCIVAIAARFSSDDFFRDIEPRARGEPYIREAESLLDLHDVSRQTLRLAVLLGTYYGADGDSTRENLYYTVACRIAGLLGVPDLDAETSIDRELDIRLYWTLQVIDLWSSNAVHQPQVLRSREDVPQPLPDGVFLEMRRASDASIAMQSQMSASEQLTTSIFAEKIKLNFIFAEIAELTTASTNRTISGSEVHTSTERLAEKLTSWRHQLSPWLVDTQENLAFHASRGTGGSFVAMYLGYYHFAQLLFYRYLHLPNIPDYLVSPNSIRAYSYAERCRVNSTALCGTLYNAYATPGAEVYSLNAEEPQRIVVSSNALMRTRSKLRASMAEMGLEALEYSVVGHVLVVASTVQLHILLFSDNDAEISAARDRLERNFQILCRLQKFWRALDISLDRFRSFHEACIRSKTSSGGMESAFRLDKWMIGFMIEFSRPIEERPEEELVVVEDDVSSGHSQTEDIEHNFASDLHQWSIDAVGIDFQWSEQDW